MGTISRFDVDALARQHGLTHFVETGTGAGEAITYVKDFAAFGSLRSCDIEPSLVARAKDLFKTDRRIVVLQGASVPFLRKACREIPSDEPILFWLDAHFPGADYGIRQYDAENDFGIRLPLMEELLAIAASRPHGRDVVAIDDLRIYVDGPFGHGNVPDNIRPLVPKHRGIGFVHKAMGATHDVHTFFDHEGYILLTPKKGP